MRLLLIEDDQKLSNNLKGTLQEHGFAVDATGSGIDGEYLARQFTYDLIVLDLGLPDKSGLEVLKSLRQQKNGVPVIILTARNAWYEKVDGFKAGADDYLGKPFHSEELLARITALIRRTHQQVASRLSFDDLELDEEKQVLIKDKQTIDLTDIEFRLLRYFLLHPGQILSKNQIEEHIYELEADTSSNVIEVYINRLRQKIGKEKIRTRRNQGYVLG